mmetsp:Transcript_16202/g.34212  ORF Transcript_16202/g.34212 Transcript_16202/m.34212 type:complete len:81 (-) Transcript_16202:1440-1682(-)
MPDFPSPAFDTPSSRDLLDGTFTYPSSFAEYWKGPRWNGDFTSIEIPFYECGGCHRDMVHRIDCPIKSSGSIREQYFDNT